LNENGQHFICPLIQAYLEKTNRDALEFFITGDRAKKSAAI